MQWTVRLEARMDQGEVKTTELTTFRRPAMASTLAEIGFKLAEAKALLARLQASLLCAQVAEYAAHRRACPACGMLQPLKDRRTRRLQTLFGTVEVEAPRFRVCRCRLTAPTTEVVFSPVSELLTARCTPELERVQAELVGAHTAFREAARILCTLLPASPVTRESVRTCTHAVALRLEATDRQAAAAVGAAQDGPSQAAVADASWLTVMLDGTYVRAVPGHQPRNFEAICGKVEQEDQPSRRFAVVRSVAERPHALLRAALLEQGWREGGTVTVISDGDPALPALVRTATKVPVELILDWFHLSMRVRHVEQALLDLCALEPAHLGPLDRAQGDVERLRHLLWNDRHEDASEALGRIVSWAEDTILANGAAVEAKTCKLVTFCTALHITIGNNEGALIDYGERYEAGKPISSSRAAGTVNHLVSARMNKRQQMRWTPDGAHRVLQVRAAVLDGTLRRRPAGNPARGVAPQVFAAPLATRPILPSVVHLTTGNSGTA